MSGTYTAVPSFVTRALEIGLSHMTYMILQPTTSADGCITLFAVWHQLVSHSIEIHLLSCIGRNAYANMDCLQSLRAWRKVLQTSSGSVTACHQPYLSGLSCT